MPRAAVMWLCGFRLCTKPGYGVDDFTVERVEADNLARIALQ